MDLRWSLLVSTGILSLDEMINVADRAFSQLMWFPEFNSDDCIGPVLILEKGFFAGSIANSL